MKKNKFLVFVFSFIPGCGHMYLGYMKRGVQVMLTFCTAVYLTFAADSMNYFSAFTVLFAITLPVIWLYQFFDCMHTFSRMRRLELELPDNDAYVVPEKLQLSLLRRHRTIAKAAAIAMIVSGSLWIAFAALNNIIPYVEAYYFAVTAIHIIRSNLVPGLLSLALIIAGISLLKGSKKEPKEGE